MIQPVPCTVYDADPARLFGELKAYTERAWYCLMKSARVIVLPVIRQHLQTPTEGAVTADDILLDQVAKLAVEIRAGKFDDPEKRGAKFTSILYGRCRNAAIDVYRRTQRQPMVDVNDSPELPTHLERTDGAEEQRIRQEDQERFQTAVTQLSPRQREVLDLLIDQELPPAEVATLMIVSVATVYNLKAQALLRLKQLLR